MNICGMVALVQKGAMVKGGQRIGPFVTRLGHTKCSVRFIVFEHWRQPMGDS